MKTRHPLTLVIAAALLLPCAHAADLKPSRWVASDQLTEHLSESHARLSIRERQFDPFGQSQDPNVRAPQPKPPVGGDGGPVGGHQLAFAQMVDRIPVTIVIPKQERAMIGGKFFVVGQEFPVRFRNRNYDVELIKVTRAEVDFRNVKTDEVATQRLKIPVGMRKGEELQKNFAPELRIDLD